jgi:beta-galactosidase
MSGWTRRDILKTGMAASVAAAEPLAAPAAPKPAADAQTDSNSQTTDPLRERLLLDFGWRFHFGHADDMTKDFNFGRSGTFAKTGNFVAPGRASFDDSDWKEVDLPHDWAVELPFQNDPALSSRGFYPLGRNYPETSIGWYRRVFDMPAADAGKRISLEFDGAYRHATVVFNNFYIGEHGSGYAPFRFDVTDFANPGGRNVLLVRIDATLSDGWFYEGAGIYRHVWLVKTAPVHVRQWGTFVRADVHPEQAMLSIRTEVDNESKTAVNTRVTSTVRAPGGAIVGKATTGPIMIGNGDGHSYEQQLAVSTPVLWSLEERNKYTLTTEIEAGGTVVDRYETPFGIRTIAFDAEKGFFLNGKSVKIKGTCNHQDHAGLGAALPDAVQYFRMAKLIEMGSNGLRTSHNPPTPELLDACDDLGMLVFDETRMMSSNPEGLEQFRALVRRDRNHPSVFMWSMGNEEGEGPTEYGLHILTAMKAVATEEDGSRPVSIAPLGGNNMNKGGYTVCDVQGYNYADPVAEKFHEANPKLPVIGTETVSAVGTRGIYIMDPANGYVSSYDPWTLTGRASAEGWWSFINARPWNSGGFVWTGFDYRGEPSPYQWPNISSQYGIIDTCGFPKDSFFYYQSWWTAKPVLHILPHWNWPGMEGKDIVVCVYSNLEKVELLLNGKSLGTQEMEKDRHVAWRVPYDPGVLEARGLRGGRRVLAVRRETTGPAVKLVLRPDRQELNADGEDVAMFAVEAVDSQGRSAPLADNEVTFRVTGPAKLIGVGNGDPTCHESDKGDKRRLFCGLAMGLVQVAKEAGSVTVEVTSPGLASASASIKTNPVKLRPAVPVWMRQNPKGQGITGLWRQLAIAMPAGATLGGFGRGAGQEAVFTFRQDGATLTGTAEGVGGDQPVFLEDGKVDGGAISFKVAGVQYKGTVGASEIELERSGGFGGFGGGRNSEPPAGEIVPLGATAGQAPPAIGPPPPGSDPSRFQVVAALTGGGRRMPQFTMPPMILRRAER